jgi:uncharacterized protein (TIGR03435 family)
MHRIAIVSSVALTSLAMTAPLLPSQTAAPPTPRVETRKLVFDVVSINPTRIASESVVAEFAPGGDGLTIRNMTPQEIIEFAYGFHRSELVSGLPKWATTQKYDMEAKLAGQDLAEFRNRNQDQRKQMLQDVLADRFRLKLHHKQKETSIYALVIAKGGAKLKQSLAGDTYSNGTHLQDGTAAGSGTLIGLTGQGVPIATLAQVLSRLDLGREVLDQTGLTGKYDFALRCSPTYAMRPVINGQVQPLSAEEETLPDIFTALQEQLGLKLEPTKGTVDGLVIDHIETPAAN